MEKKVGKTLTTSLLWAITLPALGASMDNVSAANPPRLTIRVWDRIQLNSQSLNHAKAVVETVYARIGLDIVWVHCGTEQTPENLPCQFPSGSGDISLRIIRLSKADGLRWRSLACGVAAPREAGSGIVYIFYDRVEAALARSKRRTSLELFFGITMAHEIGHLLLPPGHSLKGIMRARLDEEDWKLAEIGRLTFHRQEAEQIIRTVDRRMP